MLKSYEATYDRGRLKWAHEKPAIKDGRHVLVVVEAEAPTKKWENHDVQKILDRAWGAWGTGKTVDEIDREIEAVRKADWERNWEAPQDEQRP